jgi:hypothetical protein
MRALSPGSIWLQINVRFEQRGDADLQVRHRRADELLGRPRSGGERMAGQIKRMLERIVDVRGKGDDVLRRLTRAKLILKGFDPARFTAISPEDDDTIARVKQVARELGVML